MPSPSESASPAMAKHNLKIFRKNQTNKNLYFPGKVRQIKMYKYLSNNLSRSAALSQCKYIFATFFAAENVRR